jgi:uncharacterized membrane protein
MHSGLKLTAHYYKEVSMKINENVFDRIIRILLSVGLGAIVFLKIVTGIIAVIFGVLAGILFITGTIGFCAIYALFGLSTIKTSEKG